MVNLYQLDNESIRLKKCQVEPVETGAIVNPPSTSSG
jgi:hypothetical protein